MPSLKDLAKECGVSVATVSKALNDQPDIAAATRERIRAAARRMGYLPNAAARASKPTVLIIWGSCSLTNGKAA